MRTTLSGDAGCDPLECNLFGKQCQGTFVGQASADTQLQCAVRYRNQMLKMKMISCRSSFIYSAFVMTRGIAITTPLMPSLVCVTSSRHAIPTKTALPVSQGTSSAGKLWAATVPWGPLLRQLPPRQQRQQHRQQVLTTYGGAVD